MKIPSSLWRLAHEIEAVSGAKCPWILLDPGSPAHQTLWHFGSSERLRLRLPEGVDAAVRGVPTGGQGATDRAEWVRKLLATLDLADGCRGKIFVLPIIERCAVKACVGCFWPDQVGVPDRLAPHLSAMRQQFQKARALEKARTEAEALRWLLARSDRVCAVVRPDGELLGSTLSARDFLQGMRFGQRHFFRSDEPELPSSLARSVGQSDTGQVVLNESCTARFERLALTGGAWMPVLGIEFFSESSSPLGLPLSRLTAVERDIYGQIVAGATNAEIAHRRGTAFSTVKNQVSHLLDKLGVSRRIELLSPPSGIQFLQANSAVDGGSTAVTR